MTSLLSPETFEFFARYLLAGYVVIIIRARFVAGLRPKPTELVVEAIILSLWVQLLTLIISTAMELIGAIKWLDVAYGETWHENRLIFLAEILVLPAALGLFFGWTLSAGWKNALLRRLSLPIIHPVRTGYDFWFGREPEPCLLIITFDDGTAVSGYFGQESLAASDPSARDIFLEYLYTKNQEGTWVEPTVKRSALITLTNVRTIEILEVESQHDEK